VIQVLSQEVLLPARPPSPLASLAPSTPLPILSIVVVVDILIPLHSLQLHSLLPSLHIHQPHLNSPSGDFCLLSLYQTPSSSSLFSQPQPVSPPFRFLYLGLVCTSL